MTLCIWACALLTLTASCDDPEVVLNELPITYDYALDLPPEFVRQDVMGIDSKVEEFRSADAIVGTDFGHHSGPPSCTESNESCEIHSEQIAGRDALVGLYRHGPNERPGEPKPFRVFVHVRVDERQGLALNLFARCDTQRACDAALGHFRRVRLLRTNPPPARRAAPPPPAPAMAPVEPG
jgi:hypothetical protein